MHELSRMQDDEADQGGSMRPHDDDIREAFRRLFGQELEEGRERFRTLLRRAVNLGSLRAGTFVDQHGTTRMSDRDFALIAFFGCLGAGAFDELGLKALPQPEERSNVIDVDVVDDIKLVEVSLVPHVPGLNYPIKPRALPEKLDVAPESSECSPAESDPREKEGSSTS